MLDITEELISRAAPNAQAISNAKKISKSGDFIALAQSEDGALLFGSCRGSGKNPYQTSADFIDPGNPVYRCSCPSRQFPCKHALALLYDYLAGKSFSVEPIPAEITQKRDKQAASAEKKKTAAPKQVNQAALAKKMKKQIEGLDLAAQFVKDLLKTGLAAASQSPKEPYKELTKQLGDYYLPGPQALVNGILMDMEALKEKEDADLCYRSMAERLKELHAVIRKGKAFLEGKLETSEVLMEDSLLYDRLGAIWQLTQLKELGLYKENASLVQLSFQILYDEARAEFADTGWWVELQTGALYKTENLRPLRAIKHLKQDDTMLERLSTPCLYLYPGEKNIRVRWEEGTTDPLTEKDLASIRSFAAPELAGIIKEAKNILKNTLSERGHAVLLSFKRIGEIDGGIVLEDPSGATISLIDRDGGFEITNRLRDLPDPGMLENGVLFGELFYDAPIRRIALAPHSIVTEHQIIRLTY